MTDEAKALVANLRDEDSYYRIQEKHWCIDGEELERQRLAAADLIETQAREIERLRKLTCATWFYMPGEGDCCRFSPHEVIDEMYDPEPGNHVFEVECATSLPSIWCAVRVTDDPDADERFTFTEHATEAEARATLGDSHDQ